MPGDTTDSTDRVVTLSSQQREFGHFLDALGRALDGRARLQSDTPDVPTNARMRTAVPTRKVHVEVSEDVSLEEFSAAVSEAYRQNDPVTSGRGESKLRLNAESPNWPEATLEIGKLTSE